MAAANNVRSIENVPEYQTQKKDPKVTNLEQRFRFDGELYTLRRPKMMVATTMLRLAEADEMSTEGEAGNDMVRLMSSLIGYVKKEKPGPGGELRGQARLIHRLQDPADDLDLMDLAQPFVELIQKVFERPTGKPPVSSERPARTGRGGAASTRSTRVKTSTT